MLAEILFLSLMVSCIAISGWIVVPMIAILAVALMPPDKLLKWLHKRSDGHVIFSFDPPVSNATDITCVHLTIDDVPTANTPLILKTLKECGDSKATFFVIGSYARANPQIIRDIVDAGHQIGNHDDENRLTVKGTESSIYRGLLACESTLKNILLDKFKPIKYMRPGCGAYSDALIRASTSLGYDVLLGNAYGHDCQMQFFPSFLKWFYLYRMRPGAVVILHDGSARRCNNTVEVIKHLYKNGVRFVLPPN